MKIVNTICPYCGVGCGIDLKVRRGRVIDCAGTKENPVNKGRLCVKGLAAHEFVHSKDRLKKPILHGKKVSWKKALDYVKTNLRKVVKDDPNKFGFFSSAKCTNEENYLFQKFVRFLGTNNIDNCARLCQAPSVLSLGEAFGLAGMPSSIEELSKSDCLLVMGSNMLETHPVLGNMLLSAREKGTKIIVVDPRRTITAATADLHVQIDSATDVAFLNSVMNEIIIKSMYDSKSVSGIENFEELNAVVSKYPSSRVAKFCNIQAKLIKDTAKKFAKAKRAAILTCMGLTQQSYGLENITCCANLALLTGNIDKPGTGVNPLRGQNNVQGVGDMGCFPDIFPGYVPVNKKNANNLSEKFGFKVPGEPGLKSMDIVMEVDALYIVGENPAVTHPNQNHIVDALMGKDLLIVQDIFPTETTKLADVVLPATCYAEKDGTFTNTERRVQRLRKAVEPPRGAKSDLEIMVELGKLVGVDFPKTPELVFEEIKQVCKPYAPIDYSELGIAGERWFFKKPRAHKFYPIEYKYPKQDKDEEYPFVLTTGRLLTKYHSNSMTGRSSTLNKVDSDCFVEINMLDARKLGINSGEWIKVQTNVGSLTTRAKVTKNIKQGTVFMPFHFAKSAANKLVGETFDDLTGTPALKFSYAKLVRVE